MSEMTRKQETLSMITESPRLPSLPSVALEVLDLTQKADAKVPEIAEAISRDPALASKILKTVNSSYYGLSQSVSTIQHAMVMLGMNSVKTLALGFSLLHGMKLGTGENTFDMMTFWRRSLYSAVAARTLAQHAKCAEFEEAFLAALLQDLGIVIMMETLGPEYVALVNQYWDRHEDLIREEKAHFGVTHSEVGAVVANNWKFPDILLEPIRYSDEPTKAPAEVSTVTEAVGLGSIAARAIGENPNVYDLRDYQALSRKWFRMSNQEADNCLMEIGKGAQEISKLFDLTTQGMPDPEVILSQANETLAQLAMEQAMHGQRLQEEKNELERKATIDALTGVANRGKLNDFLNDAFEASKITASPLSLIFIDADKFKGINDTLGHAAGDTVLKSLASTLVNEAPQGSLVGRYGGEEFAIVLPNTELVPAAKHADRIRKVIEALSIHVSESNVLKVTVSMGVSTAHAGKDFQRFEQVIDAADKAVYAAKASGRNCVRIFTPG